MDVNNILNPTRGPWPPSNLHHSWNYYTNLWFNYVEVGHNCWLLLWSELHSCWVLFTLQEWPNISGAWFSSKCTKSMILGGASPYSWVNAMYMILKINYNNIFHVWHCQKSPNSWEIVWICMKYISDEKKPERSHHVTGWTWSTRILTVYAQNYPWALVYTEQQQATSWVSRIGLEHIIQFMRLQNAHESMHCAAHGHILRQRGWNQAGRHIHAAGLGGKVPRIGNMLVTGVWGHFSAAYEGVSQITMSNLWFLCTKCVVEFCIWSNFCCRCTQLGRACCDLDAIT